MGIAGHFALVDLFVPAHAGSLDEVLAAADRAGLDAIVLVAEALSELPTDEQRAALATTYRCHLHLACVVSGAGFRFALLAPHGFEGLSLESVESSGDPKTVQAAAAALGGVALPVSPRQGASGEVARQVPPLPPDGVGVLAFVAAGGRLGRDLDIEDAAIAERRILGGTGPFGGVADIGRYATVLPADASDLASLVGALQRGLGVCVELGAQHAAKQQKPEPSPFEGREAEAEDAPAKRKRRRRRRGKKPDGTPGEGGEVGDAAAEGGESGADESDEGGDE